MLEKGRGRGEGNERRLSTSKSKSGRIEGTQKYGRSQQAEAFTEGVAGFSLGSFSFMQFSNVL